MSLNERIADQSARVGVIGLGYVGLPLAVAFARAGYQATGIDLNGGKIETIQAGRSYIPDVPTLQVSELVGKGMLRATTDYAVVADLDVIFICVPTPYTAAKAPDISFIESASRDIARHIRPGQLVILQSTTYPGTTEEAVLPILESGGLKAGVDFHLAFSPERVDPGNRAFTVANTPKVVGGLTPACSRLAAALLEHITPDVRIVSTPRAAELTKLLENTFRSVNIALVNELALLCERMGIDIWEVIQAASSKPFGFMPFTPGPGVGGHCIPVDPYYLSWKAREYDFYTKFIELAAEVNQSMPYHVVEIVADALSRQGEMSAGSTRAGPGRRLQARYRRRPQLAGGTRHRASPGAWRPGELQRPVRALLFGGRRPFARSADGSGLCRPDRRRPVHQRRRSDHHRSQRL